MYANFYYQKSTKKYGRGEWLPTSAYQDDDPMYYKPDLVLIGQVYDQELFKDAELSV